MDKNENLNINVKANGVEASQSKIGKFLGFLKSRFVITLGDVSRALKTMIGFFVNASKQAQEQERVIVELNQALKNQGIYTANVSKKLLEQASALQKITTFGDEAITSLQTQLISFGVLPSEIDKVVRATLDMAQAQGMDLVTAGQLLAKSLGSQTNALARYGIEITGAVGSAERLNSAVENITKKFGGQATEATKTTAGAIKQLSNNWGDLQETIMTSNTEALFPYIKYLNNIIQKATDFVALQNKWNGEYATLGAYLQHIMDLEKERDRVWTSKKRKKEIEEEIATTEALAKAERMRIEANQKLQESIDKQNENEKKKLLEAEQAKEKQKEFDKAVEDSRGQSQKKQYEVFKKYQDDQIAYAKYASDLMGSITADGGQNILEELKKGLMAQIDAWIATEIGKAMASAPMTLGASLGAIAPIIGAGSVAKAGINAVKFHDGGTVTEANSMPAPTGNPNDRMVIADIGETFNGDGVQGTRGGGVIQVNLMLDRKVLAKELVILNKQQAKGIL